MLQQLNRRLYNGYNTIIAWGCFFNFKIVCYGLRQLCLSYKGRYILLLCLLLLLFFSNTGNAQQRPGAHDIKHYGTTTDSTKAEKDTVAAKKKRNIFQSLLKVISKKHPD